MDPTSKHSAAHGWRAVERATPGDVVTLAMDLGPVPSHVGAILRFAGIPGADLTAMEQLVVDRAGGCHG